MLIYVLILFLQLGCKFLEEKNVICVCQNALTKHIMCWFINIYNEEMDWLWNLAHVPKWFDLSFTALHISLPSPLTLIFRVDQLDPFLSTSSSLLTPSRHPVLDLRLFYCVTPWWLSPLEENNWHNDGDKDPNKLLISVSSWALTLAYTFC